MIHMKSLIRRLDCVPWLLAACFALVWAGEAQALAIGQGGRLEVAVDAGGDASATRDVVVLELDMLEVNEGALGANGSHKDQASVPIKVTATRLKANGMDKMNDDDAKGKALMRISLNSIANEGAGAASSLMPTTLTRPASVSGSPPNDRYILDMPMLIIPKDKAKGEVTVSFYPNDDELVGSTATSATEVIEAARRGVQSANDDLRIWITGNNNDGADDQTTSTLVRPAYFHLRDNDRKNAAITFTFDKTSISKEADRMAVVVTASLDAQPAEKALTFSFKDVADGRTPDVSGTVNDEGFQAIATSENGDKVASRDAFYRGSDFGDIVIPKGKMSASKTIHIDPINVNKSRLGEKNTWIALGSEDSPITVNPDGLADGGDNPTDSYMITVVPGFIKITDEGLPRVDSVTEVSSPIYEDAGDNQEAKVKINLKAAAPDGGITVSVTIKQVSGKGTRDTEYEAEVDDSRLVIPAGEKSGIATIFVSPEDNDAKNDWQFEVHVDTGDVTEEKIATIAIVDDEGDISSIELTADPDMISEIDGETAITIIAHVIGKAHTAAVDIPLTALGGSAAREVDYTASLRTLTIPAGEITATQMITITPVADEKDDGDGKPADETIEIGSTMAKADTPGIVKIGDKDINVERATITLKDKKSPPPEVPEEMPALSLADDDPTISGTVGEELEEELPAATTEDEDAEVTHLLSGDLPAGLSFDAATRTISGTPMAAGEAEVTYYATDGTNAASLTYTITIAAAPTPEVNLEGITSSHTSVRENDDQATTITLTVTLAKAAGAGGESISLGITTPTEGKAAERDTDFDATLDGSITIAEGARSGTAQLTLTPKDNTTADGHKAFGVQATSSSGHSAQVDIGISDNESDSAGIVLSVDPDEVSEGTTTSVTVTASLDGKAAGEDVTVNIGISSESSASRDVDYSADFDPRAQITIAAGDVSGTTSVSINAVADDDAEEGEETIILTGSADDLAMGSAAITLADGEMMAEDDMGDGDMDDGMMAGLHFAEEVADQAYTAGTAITDLVLPEAMGGEGDVTYQTFGLPEGLSFDAETRTVSGTPAAAAEADVLYLATDSTGEDEALEFSITVNAALSFGDLFGAGKIVPDSHGLTEIREFVIGQPVEGLTLPEGAGGTAPLTYSLSPALPAGLTFDAATRTIAGTPMAASETVYTYTVTDANGASLSMSLQTLPAAFSLADNFPNPFNPATTIQYALPQAADVELIVYNVLGQPVRTLVAEHQNAGRYVVEWDATNDSGHSLSSGMYFYRLQAGGEFLKVKKMLLLK